MRKKAPVNCRGCGTRTAEWKRIERDGQPQKLCYECAGWDRERPPISDTTRGLLDEAVARLPPQVQEDFAALKQSFRDVTATDGSDEQMIPHSLRIAPRADRVLEHIMREPAFAGFPVDEMRMLVNLYAAQEANAVPTN